MFACYKRFYELIKSPAIRLSPPAIQSLQTPPVYRTPLKVFFWCAIFGVCWYVRMLLLIFGREGGPCLHGAPVEKKKKRRAKEKPKFSVTFTLDGRQRFSDKRQTLPKDRNQ